MDIARSEDGAAERAREAVEPLDPGKVISAVEVGCGEVAERRDSRADGGELGLEQVEVLARPGDEGDPVGVRGDVGEGEVALALDRAGLPEGEQARQAGIAFAIPGVGEEVDRLRFPTGMSVSRPSTSLGTNGC